MRTKIWKTATLVLATVLITLMTHSAIARHIAGTTVSGTSITAVKVVRETASNETTSTSYVNLPGASTTITVPTGQKALILARFSAESVCYAGQQGHWCSVRILVGGVQAEPADGLDFGFDSVEADQFLYESHSMDRSRGPLSAGSYLVRVQVAVTLSSVVFRLDDWSLTVERVRVP